jgi:hypothetical protein
MCHSLVYWNVVNGSTLKQYAFIRVLQRVVLVLVISNVLVLGRPLWILFACDQFMNIQP